MRRTSLARQHAVAQARGPVAEIAQGIGVSTDELLGLAPITKANGAARHRCFLRRLQLIDKLPKRDQDAVLRTIDAFLAARRAS